MKNHEELINTRFEKSREIDEKFLDLWKKEGFTKAALYVKNMGATILDIDNYAILLKIDDFTKDIYTDEEKEKIFGSLIENHADYVKKASVEYNPKFKTNEAIIETIDNTIRVVQFSKTMPQIKEKFPYIETEDRAKKCYDMVYRTCLGWAKNSEIVTGYVYGYTDISEFLHSWLEITIKGEEYVVDLTFNTIINKEGYYKMRKVKPLTRISRETLVSDIEKYMAKIEVFPLTVYFLYRDEIIKDLEKNEEIFKK